MPEPTKRNGTIIGAVCQEQHGLQVSGSPNEAALLLLEKIDARVLARMPCEVDALDRERGGLAGHRCEREDLSDVARLKMFVAGRKKAGEAPRAPHLPVHLTHAIKRKSQAASA